MRVDEVVGMLKQVTIAFFALSQALLGLSSGVTKMFLFQGLLDCLSQAREPVFEQVVRGALLHTLYGPFLAEIATDNDERHVKPTLLHVPQSTKCIELRQVVIGENDVQGL